MALAWKDLNKFITQFSDRFIEKISARSKKLEKNFIETVIIASRWMQNRLGIS